MAILASRILETKRERIIVITLLALAIPCSAQLGVMLAQSQEFRRIGKGLYTVTAAARKRFVEADQPAASTLSRSDKELIAQDPGALTQKGRDKRLELIKQREQELKAADM